MSPGFPASPARLAPEPLGARLMAEPIGAFAGAAVVHNRVFSRPREIEFKIRINNGALVIEAFSGRGSGIAPPNRGGRRGLDDEAREQVCSSA